MIDISFFLIIIFLLLLNIIFYRVIGLFINTESFASKQQITRTPE